MIISTTALAEVVILNNILCPMLFLFLEQFCLCHCVRAVRTSAWRFFGADGSQQVEVSPAVALALNNAFSDLVVRLPVVTTETLVAG